ncbi:calmin [Echinops telfairi]|uniref:Calmin n=1 Tax=Echinops telfairi TaxID=9371 RepID=A0AC55CX22_ECHTE|nr:calmin [Echinops telfairi]
MACDLPDDSTESDFILSLVPRPSSSSESHLNSGLLSHLGSLPCEAERESVQKRTFTRWINLHLEKCNPPLEVNDLFVDIQDGKILMALLEVLSGRNLLHEYKSSTHRIFRLNNIAKALKFLEDSNVKLVSIDAAEIADGNPALVLGLIWNIILFFQIKELTGNLSRNSPSLSLSPGSGGTDSDSSFPPTPTTERSAVLSLKDQRKAIKTLLSWVQRKTRKYGVAVQDFAGSWRSGLAFLAVIKAIDPSLVDMKQALENSSRENLEKAFSTAQDFLHIPRLLEPEDIMVDVPDEQSVVTYVAQFLERFPALEAEDVVDADAEAPIESTFVRIRETPSEQESPIFLLTENGEQTYTVSQEVSQPPPAKVFVSDRPESKAFQLRPPVGGSATSSELVHQLIDQVLQGSPCKASDSSEPMPETSILASRKDNRRANSLPVKKTVHFETDLYKDASCSRDPRLSLNLTPRGAKDPLRQDSQVVAGEVEEGKNPKPEAPKAPEAAPSREGVSSAGDKLGDPQTSCNGALERAEDPLGEEHSPPDFAGKILRADPVEIRVQLLSVDPPDSEDSFEGIPLKASKFNHDLVDFATTSQAFREVPSSPESPPASQGRPEPRGKRSKKRAGRKKGPAQNPAAPEPQGPGEDAGREEQGPQGPPKEAPADRKREVCEKAKCKSARRGREDDPEEEPVLEEEDDDEDRELPCNPPSSSVSLETLGSHSEDTLDFKPSPPLSKVSVIPHDLFYYPHYEVPLAAVLEAYTEGAEEEGKREDLELEDPDGGLQDLDFRGREEEEEEEEEAGDSLGSCSFVVTGQDLRGDKGQLPYHEEGATGAREAPDQPVDHLDRSAQERDTWESSHQSQEPLHSASVAGEAVEGRAAAEPVSSKKKEKRKHMNHVESSVFLAPGAIRSSDELDEDPPDHKIPSRTSHSDSSIYIRRHTNRSLESDHFSYVQLRSVAELDDRRNRISTRFGSQRLTELILQFYGIRADMKRECKHARMPMKANHSGEAMLPGNQNLPSDSLTQLVQQPDVMYFILFLWLLVYCLLLLPQLDISSL